MKAVSGRQLVKVLERNGWTLLRVRGSHHVYGKEGHDARLTVPIHGNQDLKPGFLHALLKAAGLSETDL